MRLAQKLFFILLTVAAVPSALATLFSARVLGDIESIAIRESADALEAQAVGNLTQLVRERAAYYDLLFEKAAGDVLADRAGGALDDPQMYAFFVDGEGRPVGLPPQGLEDLGITGPAPLSQHPHPQLRQVVQRMALGESGVARLQLGDRYKLVAYAPVEAAGWSLALVQGFEDSMAWAREVSLRVQQVRRQMAETTLLVAAILVGLGALVAAWASRTLARPIGALVEGARAVGAGKLGHRIDLRGRDEVAQLAAEFNRMAEQLQEYSAGLEQKVAERTRRLAAINAVAQSCSQSLELQAVLDHALERVTELMGADGGVVLLEEDRGTASAPAPAGQAGTGKDSEAGGVQPLVLAASRSLSTEELRALEDALRAGALAFAAVDSAPLAQAVEGVGWACPAPLVAKGRRLGLLAVVHRERRSLPADPADRELLLAIGNQVAVAVENARLYGRAQQTAILEERNRLARELHDSVTQSLFSISLVAQAIPALLERNPAAARERLNRLIELAKGALAEMRALIFELRPLALQEEGLATALAKYVELLRSRDGLQVELRVTGGGRLPARWEEALYRVAQEALHNVVKHARTAQAVVELRIGPNSADLAVIDGGVGFEADQPRQGRHFGLSTMRERVEQLGGTFEVRSKPGQGTVVEARLSA